MATTDSVLRRGIEGEGDERILTLDPAFQGLPETAHGGSVLAVFDAIAAWSGPRRVAGLYRRRVPLDVPLRLAITRTDAAVAYTLRDDSGVLADGRVSPAADDDRTPPRSGDPPRPRLQQPRVSEGPPTPSGETGHPLPVSASCLACGIDNRLGLQVRLTFDDEAVWGTWSPREAFRAPDGGLAPVALTTLLDEAAFWLGALASGESGMTTDLRVTLHRRVPLDTAIRVAGGRRTVRRHADDPRYWTTEVAARDGRGELVAAAEITFVAVRGAARRLVNGMLSINPPDVVRRVFPAYAR
ncbi:MAG: hypothetical protein HY727_13280 [Candidatus Rokubacteria bacterium]|nr:hypothetical protein [Candidatus Rokubacteria bacterium]